MVLTSMLQAIGLFLATNIDDVVILSLFFGRGQGQPGTTGRTLLGQYLGFIGILGAAALAAFGAQALLPAAVLPYFGLIPLAIGLWAAWQAWQHRGLDGDDAQLGTQRVSAWTVAAMTFANGGDNIGVYVPVFVSVSWHTILTYCIVFLLLVGILVFLAKWIASRKPIAEALERWEHVLFPTVLIGLGIIILVGGGAFGL
ncbi:cadmium resistance transporter [Enteractinococcus helveticum]|uniref:Cadmium transporter n=1 Tax=Enteractinococcus helveticum TaxID=1837282 RepID=A0A1B7M1I9_9MICC|nr:cadmium resistance transporter [Enteractinococcus helveticum]OAV62420.1 cadmium transporter [Enteractinococcus helveticum]